MNRIKVSKNFYADEFLNIYLYYDIWKKGGDALILRYLNINLVNIAQKSRDLTGSSVTINNWWNHYKIVRKGFKEDIVPEPGRFINSGLRYLLNPHREGSLSRHYFNECIDEKFTMNSFEYYHDILIPNLAEFQKLGLTAVEDIEATKGKNGRFGWVHKSTEMTNQKRLVIIHI